MIPLPDQAPPPRRRGGPDRPFLERDHFSKAMQTWKLTGRSGHAASNRYSRPLVPMIDASGPALSGLSAQGLACHGALRLHPVSIRGGDHSTSSKSAELHLLASGNAGRPESRVPPSLLLNRTHGVTVIPVPPMRRRRAVGEHGSKFSLDLGERHLELVRALPFQIVAKRIVFAHDFRKPLPRPFARRLAPEE